MNEKREDNNAAMDAANETGQQAAGETRPETGDMPAMDEIIARLEAEKAELTDRFVRTVAEMENLRKRTARDVSDARSYSIAGFARDILGVADNLARALEAIPEDARRSEDPGYKALIEGVELTGRDLSAALERHGVRKIEPEGEKFDPNFHQAMFEVPNPAVPANTVVQVVQAGYVIGERVLRPAMVGVAKGGPKAAAEPEPGPVNGEASRDA